MLAAAVVFVCVVTILICPGTAIDKNDIASTLHHQGISAAMEGNYDASLAYLRAACRKNGQHALFWNDLGVTEMRVGQYLKAKKRFLRALEIDPSFQLSVKNLEELATMMPADQWDDLVGQSFQQQHPQQQHVVLPFPTHSAEEFVSITHNSSYTDTLAGYKRFLSAPFVIRGALQQWGFNLSAMNLDYVSRRLP